MAFDPLDCGKNPAQKALDAADKLLAEKKAALKNAVDLPDADFASALSDLKTAATDKLSALNLTIPEIPKIPNFQEEIDKLMAKGGDITILKDLQALEDSWKDIIPLEKIQGLTNKIKDVGSYVEDAAGNLLPNIDVCKETPKQDADIETDSAGNVTLKKKQTPPVAKAPEETVKPDPKETPPAASEDEVLEVVIRGRSTITARQAYLARKSLKEAEKTVLQKIKAAERAEMTELKATGNTRNLDEAVKAIPPNFISQYPDATPYDYYCSDNFTGVIPSIINGRVLKYSKLAAYADMKKSIMGLHTRIINTLDGVPAHDGKARWNNGWDKRYELELRAGLYYDQGFGIREYHPSYGFGLRNHFNVAKTADKVKSAFAFKIRDYKATFTPRYQDAVSLRSGAFKGEADTTFSNLISDYITAIYDAKVTILGETTYAFLALVSYRNNIDIAELSDFPKEKDFIPVSLGGKLPLYEDYLDGNITASETNEASTFSESSFKPHYMYKAITSQNRVVSQYAETHQEHISLSQLGYVHDPKGF